MNKAIENIDSCFKSGNNVPVSSVKMVFTVRCGEEVCKVEKQVTKETWSLIREKLIGE